MEYRGFVITFDADADGDGMWWATAGSGLLNLGPFDTLDEAKAAVDEDLGE